MSNIRDTSNPLIKNATGCMFLRTAVGNGTLGDTEVDVSTNVTGEMIVAFKTKDGTRAQYIVAVRAVVEAAHALMVAGE